MAFYAVKKGKKTGLYEDWASCQEQIKGFPNAEFHKFDDEKDALRYLMGEELKPKAKPKSEIVKLKSNTQCNVFTGGVYVKDQSRCNLAIIIEDINGKQTYFTAVIDDFCAKQQTIAAELLSAFVGLQIAMDKEYTDINLYSNWDGIKKWATKEHAPKSQPACAFVRYLDEISHTTNINIGQLKEVDKVQKKELKYYVALASSTKYLISLDQICEGKAFCDTMETYDD